MSSSQEMTLRAKGDMWRMTQAIIAICGTYLTYQPHARPGQWERAYPRASAFAAAKRHLDQGGLLGNNRWDSYLRAL